MRETESETPFSQVVITGIGLVTPHGENRETSWSGLLSGKKTTRRIWELEQQLRDSEGRFAKVIGAPAKVDWNAADENTGEPVIDLAVQAAEEAIFDAQLTVPFENAERVACVIGTSKGGLETFHRMASDPDFASAVSRPNSSANFRWLKFPPSAASSTIAGRYGIHGPCLCPVAACATGLVCLQRGYEFIKDGYCDVAIVGSSDASLRPEILASFRRLGVLARCQSDRDPGTVCRPFDRNRNGFAIGEGAGVLVMERKSHAERRGARMYAEWLAGGCLSDGFDLTRLAESPESCVRLIQDVLERGNVSAGEIDYCNLHGTATVTNDVYETRAVREAFGNDADSICFSSLKGGIGHLLGAAGSVEMAATILAMRDSVVPPTVNLDTPDPQCDLNYTPHECRSRRIETAMKLSLGFGGHLAAAIVRAV
ncbi:MAG: beta-ketoacyl-ACP synthase II [Planctomycetaceae bacterium]